MYNILCAEGAVEGISRNDTNAHVVLDTFEFMSSNTIKDVTNMISG